jgi:acetylcholinesterase
MAPVRNIKRRLGLLIFTVTIGIILSYCLYQQSFETKYIPPMSFASRPRVVLRQGTVIGKQMVGSGDQGISPQTLEYFLGIPYALSTALENRWKPATPIGSGTGEFDAGRLGKRCPAGEPDFTDMGEDCLNLNIYRPASRPKDKKLPVLVYFHGGSFNFGAGHYRRIDSMVAWSDRPMIGISFNYRLGAFGFLSSKLVKDIGALNLGLRDQSLLLQWVQDNISAFGGDPDDVTIMGCSAGAHSVSCASQLCFPNISRASHKQITYEKSTFVLLLFKSM